MSPMHLRKATRGRIIIDKRRRIHIRSVNYNDAGRYDCYVDGYLKGEVLTTEIGSIIEWKLMLSTCQHQFVNACEISKQVK